MTDKQINSERAPEEAWSEVGRQFEALGESLARAFRAVWESEETRQHVRSVQDGLEKMVNRVNRAVEDASQAPEAEQLRTEAEKTAESLRAAGEKTWREAQPHLLAALTKINEELKRVTDRLEGTNAPSQKPTAKDAAGEAGDQTPGAVRE